MAIRRKTLSNRSIILQKEAATTEVELRGMKEEEGLVRRSSGETQLISY